MKKHVMQICLSPDLGGLELYMKQCVEALQDEFEITAVVGLNSKIEPYLSATGCPCYQIKKPKALQVLSSAKKLAKLIDEKKIELIHLHWTKDQLVVVLAKLLSKQRPKLVQSRHMHITRFKDDFYHRFLYKNIDMILAVTLEVKAELKRYIPANISPKIKQLYLGCSGSKALDNTALSRFKALQGIQGDKDVLNVGLVGRIEPAKGQKLLIDAIQELHKLGIKAHAHFVGYPMQAAYLDELKQHVAAMQLQPFIHFLGYLDNPNHFYQACDVVVLATDNETFGLVLIEAMRSGTCVVGADRGGVLEIIDDKATGLLFESQNVLALSKVLESLALQPELRADLALAGQQKVVNKFDYTKQFKKLADILHSLLSENS